MPEQEPQFEERKPLNATWDVLSNQSYTERGWEKLITKRMAEYQEALEQNAYDDAAQLLLKGGLKEKLGPEEIADFADQYFAYHMSEYRRLCDPREFKKLRDSYEGLPPDQFVLLRRHLDRAVTVNRVFGPFVSSEEREKLEKMSRKAARDLVELSVQRKKFSAILDWTETQPILDELPSDQQRMIVTEGLRQYIEEECEMLGGKRISERSRAYFSEWAAKYGVEDEDILEALTGPGN